MTEYVAGFMFSKDDNTVSLVRKNKPKWQAGRLNGIGGKIETGETPYGAMVREWQEETGHHHTGWQRFAEVRFNDAAVFFYKATVEAMPRLADRNDIGEAVEIHDYATVVRAQDMIQNLKWLLPLAFEDPDGLSVQSISDNDNGDTLKVAA